MSDSTKTIPDPRRSPGTSLCSSDDRATLFANLDEYLHEVIDLVSAPSSSGGGQQNMSLQAVRTKVFLKVLEWYGLRWSQLRDLTNGTAYVQPEIATRLSEAGAGEEISPILLHQLFVRPERLGRALTPDGCGNKPKKCSSISKRNGQQQQHHADKKSSSFDFTFCLGKGGSAFDEMDAILGVDGLGGGGETSGSLPDFDLKRYVDNCRFPFSFRHPDGKLHEERDVMFEQGTEEDEDRRKHVFAVRDLYTRIPVEQLSEERRRRRGGHEDASDDASIARRVVYKTIREAFRKVSGGAVSLPPLPTSNDGGGKGSQSTSKTAALDTAEAAAEDHSSSSSSDEETAFATPVGTFEDSLIPHLVDVYLSIVHVDRAKRLARRTVEEKKPEKRGRKRKVEDSAVSSSSSKKSCKPSSTTTSGALVKRSNTTSSKSTKTR